MFLFKPFCLNELLCILFNFIEQITFVKVWLCKQIARDTWMHIAAVQGLLFYLWKPDECETKEKVFSKSNYLPAFPSV